MAIPGYTYAEDERDGFPFNGSNDPVYQEVMEAQRERVSAALELLRDAFASLDSAEETQEHADALAPVFGALESVAREEFHIA